MTKVSVVVPVYNVYNYLDKCLNSLVNQTLDDIEIVVVNDGSPDNSQKIIDKYKKKYKNVKSFIKENGGLSDARNYGIKKCSGDYIGFIDGDDYADCTMFEKLYNKAIEDNFDVVVCDINYVYSSKKTKVSSLVREDIFGKDSVKNTMINIYPAAWNKIYKREFFKKVSFKKNIWYEDVEFLYRLFPFIKSIGRVDKALINYVQRDNSIIKTFDKRLYDYIDNWNGIVDFYKKNNFYDDYKKQLEYCYVRYLYCTFIINACNFSRREFNKAVNCAINNVKMNFPKYRKNSYFYSNLKGLYMITFCFVSKNIIYYLKNKIR